MSSVQQFVGLDYHDEVVQICILDSSGRMLANRTCRNDAGEIMKIVKHRGHRVCGAIEACCGAANLAEELILRAGWSMDLAHPGYVARLKQSPDKHDFGDARLLADLERVGYLPKVWLAPENIRELRRVVRYRQQVAKERKNCKQQIRGLLRDGRVPKPGGQAWTQKWRRWLEATPQIHGKMRWIIDRQLRRLEFLEKEIRIVERELKRMTQEDPVAQKLLTLKGIGLVTAATLRAEIGHFARFRTGKQLSRFCGLSPRNASSGQRQADAGLVRAGNPELRAVLIEAAQRLKRFDPRWRRLTLEMRLRGKPENVITAAVANRWIRGLHHEICALETAC
jgi:transposase